MVLVVRWAIIGVLWKYADTDMQEYKKTTGLDCREYKDSIIDY